METKFIIYEIRVTARNVTFAGYSDGYGVEHEEVYSLVIPSWASYSYDDEGLAMTHLVRNAEPCKGYTIKKVYRLES